MTNIKWKTWKQACVKAQKQTINTRFKLLQYKWLMRMYITPVKLHHMSTNITDVCTKCSTEKGTLFHCMWECSKMHIFWNEVMKCLSGIFKTTVPLSAKLCILGIYPKNFIQPAKLTKILDFGLLQARRAVALCWKSVDAPTLRMWHRELMNSIGLERLTYIVGGRQSDFEQLWEVYMGAVETNT